MFIEHVVYSTAIAILLGMIYFRRTARDPSWIIILVAFTPDIDIIGDPVLHQDFGIAPLEWVPLIHGDLHNAVALIVFAFFAAVLLSLLKVRFCDAFLFSCIAFGLHILQDALLPPAYPLLYPISDHRMGLSFFSATRDVYGIVNAETLLVGIILLVGAIALRTGYEERGWVRHYIPSFLVHAASMEPESQRRS